MKILKYLFLLVLITAFAHMAHPQKIYKKGWIDFNKNGSKDVFEDPSQTTEKRVEDLLSQMSLEEKTCQMATLYGYGRVLKDELPTPNWKHEVWKDGIGNIDEHLNGLAYHPNAVTPLSYPYSIHVEAKNKVQKWFVEETRLGIPVDFTNEGIRGLCHDRATSFPSQLGIGASWNKELVSQIGAITGREAKVLGYTNVYSPILDVSRDPRWGRIVECYGEDPFLVSELGLRMVKALQEEGVISTPKHFAVYSVPKGGRDGNARTDPHVAPRELHQMFLMPFRKVVQEGKALGMMSSYNDWDGVPITSSRYFLTDLLREEWGFQGYVVSDSRAVEFIDQKHRTAEDYKSTIKQVVEAGLNVRTDFTPPQDFILPLREILEEGKLSIEVLNQRVREVLFVKFRQGLFDQPYFPTKNVDKQIRTPAAVATSFQASKEALVLLKNQDKLLPLDLTSLKRLLVAGPLATEITPFISRYGPSNIPVISMLEGIKRVAKGVEVLHAEGCLPYDGHWPQSEILPTPITAKEQQLIDEAVEKAEQSEVIIAVLGDTEETVGESRSRTSLHLPGNQQKFLEALHATGKPVVLVLVSGRPATINWADAHIPAILEAWFQGEFGGQAVGEALFGFYNPGGKLPVTFPKSVGQLPLNFPYKPGSQAGQPGEGFNGQGKTRVMGPIYPFGWGLSYTTFAYKNLRISPASVYPAAGVEVSFEVTNTGDREGDEVVQLYLQDMVSSVTTYEKQLRGFERVPLKPGETKEVTFVLTSDDLMLLNRNMNWVVEPGIFKVMVGSSSEAVALEGEFEVLMD